MAARSSSPTTCSLCCTTTSRNSSPATTRDRVVAGSIDANALVTSTKSYNLVSRAYRATSEWRATSIQSRGTNGMAISVNPSVIALVGAGWKSVGGQLLASGVLLLSGHQDIGLRARMGAAFGFSMAIAFGISALATAI